MTSAVLPAWTLALRETVRFLRQRNRIVGALVSPLLFWLMLGAGVGRTFRSPADGAESFLLYVFPGTLILVVLFTAVFATISIIEDRKEGFLQSVLVAPTPRSVIVLGKIGGGTFLALIHALAFLALAPAAGIHLSFAGILEVAGMLAAIAAALTGLGFAIAWRMDSVQGFHAIMNLFLLPLWVLSGAIFPPSGSATWVGWLVRINPLSYGVVAVRRLLFPEVAMPGLPGLGVSLAVTLLFAFATFALASWMARGTVGGDLR